MIAIAPMPLAWRRECARVEVDWQSLSNLALALALAASEVLEDLEQVEMRHAMAAPAQPGSITMLIDDSVRIFNPPVQPEPRSASAPEDFMPEKRKPSVETAAETVLAYLEEVGEANTNEIRDATKLNGSTAYALKVLRKRGDVVQIEPGRPGKPALWALESPDRDRGTAGVVAVTAPAAPAAPRSWQGQIEFLASWERKSPEAFVAEMLAAYQAVRK